LPAAKATPRPARTRRRGERSDPGGRRRAEPEEERRVEPVEPEEEIETGHETSLDVLQAEAPVGAPQRAVHCRDQAEIRCEPEPRHDRRDAEDRAVADAAEPEGKEREGREEEGEDDAQGGERAEPARSTIQLDRDPERRIEVGRAWCCGVALDHEDARALPREGLSRRPLDGVGAFAARRDRLRLEIGRVHAHPGREARGDVVDERPDTVHAQGAVAAVLHDEGRREAPIGAVDVERTTRRELCATPGAVRWCRGSIHPFDLGAVAAAVGERTRGHDEAREGEQED
jgi:hypothetical protein